MQQQDEQKRRSEQTELQAQLDEEELRESLEVLKEVGELSYKVPSRDWSSPAVQEVPLSCLKALT